MEIGVFSAAVGLKAVDPEAVTALQALRETMPDHAPARLLRFTLWQVGMEDGAESEDVERMLRSYEDIVNPNKHTLVMLDGDGPARSLGADAGMLWVPARVHNLDDSVSEGWLGLLKRAGYSVSSLDVSVLWLLGYAEEVGRERAGKMARRVSVTRSRREGLLGNPVSQRVTVGETALSGAL